ncbi:MAG TPA: hypothetical protein VF921_21740 [Vicinamibacterales bacterium]
MTQAPGGNAWLVGKVLAFSGVFMLGAALVAWLRWVPYSDPASRALAMIFAVTGAADLIIAFVFMTRNRR